MRVLSTRVDDWVAEQVMKLGRPSDVLRDAIIAYLSNKVGICEDLAIAQWKIMAFRDVFAKAAEVYRKFEQMYREIHDMVLSVSRTFDSERFVKLESSIKSFFLDYELGKYLGLIIDFLKVMKTEKEPYKEFDLVLEKSIKEFEDVLEAYTYIKNSLYVMGMTNSWLSLIENAFEELPQQVKEKIREETVKKALELRYNIFSYMDMRKAIEFVDFTENFYEGPLNILRKICNENMKDFQLPIEVCGIYDHITRNKLYSEYLAGIADIAEKHGMDRQEAMERLRAIILAEDDKYGMLDANLSKGALELVVLNKFISYMTTLFDLSVSSPELPYLARLIINLEKARKKICIS